MVIKRKEKKESRKNSFRKFEFGHRQSAKTGSVEKTFFGKVLACFKAQEEKIRSSRKKQFTFFILGFALFYLILTVLAGIIPQVMYKEFTGKSVQAMLSLQGIQANSIGVIPCNEFSWLEDSIAGECYSFNAGALGQEKQIIISWLCTGILEIIILIAAILSSFGISWRKKIIGGIIAIPLGVIFNLLRVWVTINLIIGQPIGTVELAHDLLFRIILFIYITGFYIIWFYWANKEK
jgi:exosortase/archaeosortase family protein